MGDKGGLWCSSMLPDDVLEPLRMPSNGFLAGFDNSFESQSVPAFVITSVRFASLELTYVEP